MYITYNIIYTYSHQATNLRMYVLHTCVCNMLCVYSHSSNSSMYITYQNIQYHTYIQSSGYIRTYVCTVHMCV